MINKSFLSVISLASSLAGVYKYSFTKNRVKECYFGYKYLHTWVIVSKDNYE